MAVAKDPKDPEMLSLPRLCVRERHLLSSSLMVDTRFSQTTPPFEISQAGRMLPFEFS